MKTIGQLLKDARLKKNYSKHHLEGKTKIKREFIDAIEEQKWNLLPEYPVVYGFVKSIASALDINPEQAIAFLRRDYPPEDTEVAKVNPKPDVSTKFVWTPKLTFLTGSAMVLLIVFSYLVLQYIKFTKPPLLDVLRPTEYQVITQNTLQVEGKTNESSTVKINNQPVLIEDDGSFVAQIEVNENTGVIEISATSRSGKSTIIRRNIKVELEK